MTQRFTLSCLPLALAAVLPGTVLANDPDTLTEERLDTVVVTASRNEMPLQRVGASVTVITREEIEQRGYTDLADLLRTMPGVAVTNTGGPGKASSIRIRGEEGFRTRVLIDGVNTADQSGTQIQSPIEYLSLQDVERIEILRGPQGMMYGADAGGVVNIITRTASNPFSASLASEYGRYDTSNTSGSISGKHERLDYVISASGESTNSFNTRKSDTVVRDDDGYDNTTLNGKFGANLTDDLRAQLTLRDVDADSEYDSCGFPASQDCSNDFRQATQRGDLDYRLGSTTHKLTASSVHTERNFLQDGARYSQYNAESDQFQYIGTWEANRHGTVLFGADLVEEQANIDAPFEPNGEYDRDQLGLYAEWQGQVGERFFYTAGMRNDDNDDFGSHDSYRATAAWLQPVGRHELKYKASYGTGFRAPSLYELAYNDVLGFPPASDAELDAETSAGYDLGVEARFANGLYLEAVYFDQSIEDAIDFDLVGFSGFVQQPGQTDSSGLELVAEYPLTDIVTVFGNYTYNETEIEGGDQRIRRPRHFGNVGTRVTVDRWRFVANMRFANDSEDQVFGVGRVPLDDHQVVDATLGYTLTDNVELYARAQNIFANDYEEVLGYHVGGAAVYAGFRLTY